jgi:hypothetical protein
MRSGLDSACICVKDGERQIIEKRWGFKFPDRLAFNAVRVPKNQFATSRLRCAVPEAEHARLDDQIAGLGASLNLWSGNHAIVDTVCAVGWL